MSTEIVLDDKVKTTLNNLLNKAGRDPRLTPRLLREKTEQKLSFPKGYKNNNYYLLYNLLYNILRTCRWIKKMQKRNKKYNL